ncbi:MAG: glycosyltransferase, partial [Candidatus Diapherotrites archaeon]
MISVIVPTLNEEKFIEKTLLALKDQTVPKHEYEVIVSDSSSS